MTDHIAGSGLELFEVLWFFNVDRWPNTGFWLDRGLLLHSLLGCLGEQQRKPRIKSQPKNNFFFLAGRSDHRLTLVFRVKTQSRAMGNTADMYDSLRADVGFSEFDAKRKSYMISNMLTNSASFSTFKHSDPPDTVRGRSTLKDGVVSGRIYFDTGRSARGIEWFTEDLARTKPEIKWFFSE